MRRLVLIHACAPADERWRKPLVAGGAADARAVPGDACAAWHRLLLARTLEAAGAVDAEVRLVTTGSVAALRALTRGRVDERRIEVRVEAPGAGTRLERLQAACADVLADAETLVVAVPGDVPELTAARIESAFDALDAADVVLGPALDGGLYLFGAAAPTPVLGTRAAPLHAGLVASGRRVSLLPPLADVDDRAAALALVDRRRGDRLLRAALADLRLHGAEPLELVDAFYALSELDALAGAGPTLH